MKLKTICYILSILFISAGIINIHLWQQYILSAFNIGGYSYIIYYLYSNY